MTRSPQYALSARIKGFAARIVINEVVVQDYDLGEPVQATARVGRVDVRRVQHDCGGMAHKGGPAKRGAGARGGLA